MSFYHTFFCILRFWFKQINTLCSVSFQRRFRKNDSTRSWATNPCIFYFNCRLSEFRSNFSKHSNSELYNLQLSLLTTMLQAIIQQGYEADHQKMKVDKKSNKLIKNSLSFFFGENWKRQQIETASVEFNRNSFSKFA